MYGVHRIPSIISWNPESYFLHEHCLLEYLQLYQKYRALLPEVLGSALRKARCYPMGLSAPTDTHNPQCCLLGSWVFCLECWWPSVWKTEHCLPGVQNTSVLTLAVRDLSRPPSLEDYMRGPHDLVCQRFWVLSLEMLSLCLADWEGSPPPPPQAQQEPLLSQTRFFSSSCLTSYSISSPGQLYPTTAVTYVLNTYCALGIKVPWYLLCARHYGNLDTYCVLGIVVTLTPIVCWLW